MELNMTDTVIKKTLKTVESGCRREQLDIEVRPATMKDVCQAEQAASAFSAQQL
jgi:hypothetical protein